MVGNKCAEASQTRKPRTSRQGETYRKYVAQLLSNTLLCKGAAY